MNAMAFDVMLPLRRAIEEISVDNDIRVVVLTGAGDGFSVRRGRVSRTRIAYRPG